MRRNAATKADLSSSGGQTSKNQRKRLRDLQGELKPEETQGMSKNLCLPPLDAAKSHPCYTDDDGAQPVPETRACTEAASENATTKPLLDAKRRAAVEDARKGIEQYLSLHDAQKLPPFVTQGMVDMLGSKFKKVPVQGALDELLAADVFKTKEFKKTVVYYPPWEVIEPQEADAKDLGEGAQQDAEKNILASENARLIDELRSVRSSIAKLQKELTFLGKQPALDEVRKAIEEKKRELKRFTDYVTEQGIQTGTPEHAVSIEDMKRAEKTCADSKLRERTYYHLCMNILHRIAADSHSIQELAALIGLDLPTGEID